MFPNVMTFKICKRLTNKNDRKILKDIKHDILNTKIPLIDIAKKYFTITNKVKDISKDDFHIAYYNDVVDTVNRICHKQVKKPHKGTFRQNDIVYYTGLDLVCRYRFKTNNHTLIVNYVYTIKKINKDYMILIRDPVIP
eukprot:Lithocolla_globosa_v1_NODE_4348_length_1456_cov_35.966453.p2 type:complete len:139 gc:universal NODE_4348_length_1456_cov_35.966453:986-1402(+)